MPVLSHVSVENQNGLKLIKGKNAENAIDNMWALQIHIMRLDLCPCWEDVPIGLQP